MLEHQFRYIGVTDKERFEFHRDVVRRLRMKHCLAQSIAFADIFHNID